MATTCGLVAVQCHACLVMQVSLIRVLDVVCFNSVQLLPIARSGQHIRNGLETSLICLVETADLCTIDIDDTDDLFVDRNENQHRE